MLTMLHRPRRMTGADIFGVVAGLTRRAALAADALLAAPFHWAESRRTLCDLAAMDDHALADIGVSRGDLRDAWSLSLLDDPTRLLVSRRSERRGGH